MRTKNQKSLVKQITELVEKLKNMDVTDANYAKTVAALSKLTSLYNEEKKNELNELMAERRLEQEKLRIAIEEQKVDMERRRLEEERDAKLREQKSASLMSILNAGVKVLEITLPLIVYASLTKMNFRLVYMDDGRQPSEMKDLMNRIGRR